MTRDEWLRASGVERSDALALLRELAGVSRAALLAHPDAGLDSACLEALERAAEALRGGLPLAYVLGWREFYGLRLELNRHVLIPRPDTEVLVDFALEHLDRSLAAEVLDLGTGSGAIAIAIAHERPLARVRGVDASAEALELARRNAERLLPPERPGGAALWHQGDWMGALGPEVGDFDLIVSNPPYVAAGDPHLAALRHEPALALVGARACADGLGDIRVLVAQAAPRLRDGAWLALEHGYDQAAAVRDLLQRAGLREVHSLRDLAGIERVTAGRAGK